MLTLKILSNKGEVRGEWRGLHINAEFKGKLSAGDKIKILANGCDFIAVKLSPLLSESIVWKF